MAHGSRRLLASAGFLACLGLGIWPPDAQAAVRQSPSATPPNINLRASTTGATEAVITNGVVTLGINDTANVDAPIANVGLRFEPTGGDALIPGCHCEGWGAADLLTGTYGFANQAQGGSTNLVVEAFSFTANSAVSVVRVNAGAGDVMRVTHSYHPSAHPNLYQADVTISNVTASPIHVRYRRNMDWDVPPSEFDELVSIHVGGATSVVYYDDNGFSSSNPLDPSTPILPGPWWNSGPDDHGALFDFDFGEVPPGGGVQFTIFYGAAANEGLAVSALGAVGAEVVSLGKPNPAVAGASDGSPNTFIFGFRGVGGISIFGCDVEMSQEVYANGETVRVSQFRAANPGALPVTVEAKVWIGLPAGPPISHINAGHDGSLVFTPGMNLNLAPIDLAVVSPGLPRGAYTFGCRLIDPVTGATIQEDIAPFRIE